MFELSPPHGTVVLADEHGPVRDYLRGLLARALPGVAQVPACDGQAAVEALELLATRPDSGPIVVVGGVRMAGVDGLEVAEHASCARVPVSVVLLCVTCTAAERERASSVGATLIEGPVGFTRLVDTVCRLLAPTQPTLH